MYGCDCGLDANVSEMLRELGDHGCRWSRVRAVAHFILTNFISVLAMDCWEYTYIGFDEVLLFLRTLAANTEAAKLETDKALTTGATVVHAAVLFIKSSLNEETISRQCKLREETHFTAKAEIGCWKLKPAAWPSSTAHNVWFSSDSENTFALTVQSTCLTTTERAAR